MGSIQASWVNFSPTVYFTTYPFLNLPCTWLPYPALFSNLRFPVSLSCKWATLVPFQCPISWYRKHSRSKITGLLFKRLHLHFSYLVYFVVWSIHQTRGTLILRFGLFLRRANTEGFCSDNLQLMAAIQKHSPQRLINWSAKVQKHSWTHFRETKAVCNLQKHNGLWRPKMFFLV